MSATETRELMYAEAFANAIAEEMRRDERVIYYGQNMAITERDPFLREFGPQRVRITPISETAEIGMAVGAAMAGLRPIVQVWMTDFVLVAIDQIINEAPRLRYMSGGQVSVPLVLNAGFGFVAGWAGQHSNCNHHIFMGIPGLKVVMPATPHDAKGLMAAAIRDDNPVVFLHHSLLTIDTGDVAGGEFEIPIGIADVKRDGSDVTLVSAGLMLKRSLAAAEELAREGIEVEVVDLRSLNPLDIDTVVDSVSRTGRLVVVDQAPKFSSFAPAVAAAVAEVGFGHLRAPVKMVTGLDASVPYSEPLEEFIIPNEERIARACRSVIEERT